MTNVSGVNKENQIVVSGDTARHYGDLAKQYRDESEAFCNSAKENAEIVAGKIDEINNLVDSSIQNISNAQTIAVNAVDNQSSIAISNINLEADDIKADLEEYKSSVDTEKTNSITEINTARDNGVNTVNSALENFDNTVETAQTDITNLKNSSVEEIKAEGEEQVATIKQTGADELSKITQSGIDAVKADVTDLKTQVAAKANMTDVWTLSTVGNASIPMSWGASGSKYIAPANGRFLLEASLGDANEYIRLYRTKNGISRVAPGNVAFVAVVDISVDKGDEVILFHNISKEPTAFKFVQANGD